MKDRKSIVRVAVILALLCVAPFFVPSYYTGLLTLILIYAIFAMSLDILLGYTGLPSLGHAAFFGTGAYIVAIINVKVFHGPHFSVELLAGVFAAAVVAALIGLIVLRNTGDYLLMILLASSMMLWGIAFKWRSLTGGDDGLPGIVRPDLAFMRVNLHNTTDFYYFVLLFFVIASFLMYLVVRSSFGHTLLGIRESETRMTALGYNVWLQKYIAFIVSGTFAGLAGVLLVYYNGFVSP
jgi:branched-chain amino acid transport system permease protein